MFTLADERSCWNRERVQSKSLQFVRAALAEYSQHCRLPIFGLWLIYGRHSLVELNIGDRVVMANCAGPAGTVLEQSRGKLLVQFDDLPAVKWLLRSSSLALAAIDKNLNSTNQKEKSQ
jgi:hypothetical protein